VNKCVFCGRNAHYWLSNGDAVCRECLGVTDGGINKAAIRLEKITLDLEAANTVHDCGSIDLPKIE
jgi:hypothetical protein